MVAYERWSLREVPLYSEQGPLNYSILRFFVTKQDTGLYSLCWVWKHGVHLSKTSYFVSGTSVSLCLLIQRTSKHLGHNSSAHFSGQAINHACSFSSFQLAQRTSRVKSWTRETEDSLAHWTSGSQSFFLALLWSKNLVFLNISSRTFDSFSKFHFKHFKLSASPALPWVTLFPIFHGLLILQVFSTTSFATLLEVAHFLQEEVCGKEKLYQLISP